MFVAQMMDLSLNIPLEEALDRGWQILAACFRPEETGFRTELINEYWPKDKDAREDGNEATSKEQAEVVGAH
jgi:V/A-type H+/Na+-transporting ATPase subunit B